MKKNILAKRIKVKADLNNPIETVEDSPNGKEFKDDENEESPDNENIYRCPKCFNIPLISVKDNENKVIIDCLRGHHTEMLFSEYMAPEYQKNIYNFECGQCGANRNTKKLIKVCHECQKIFCKDCLSLHNKNNVNHHLISFDKMDTICPLHKSKYTYYCLECKKNLCEDCIKNKNDQHQLILFNNINLKNNELNELKNNLEKENQTLFNIKKIFNDTLTQLSNKFNDIISYKFLCLKYKNNIINTYETKDTNYQIIDNLNHLKFISKDLKIEPEMNELDIIYELFNFLDSIEYNDENNNMNNNNNLNSNGINLNDKNNIILDTKIEESENEDEDENDNTQKPENENKNNKIKIGNSNNIKVEENEKDDEDENEEEEKVEESESKNGKDKAKENEDNNINRIRNDYIKINDNENENDNDNDNDNDKYNEKLNDVNIKDSNDINIISISQDGLLNQISPIRIENQNINDKNGNNNPEKEESKPIYKEEDTPIKKEDIINTEEKEKDIDEHNYNEEEGSNDNEDNIFVYKSNRHIPVNTDYNQNNKVENSEKEKFNTTEKSEDTENKEKEPKKKKKKIIKKKKIKQPIKITQTETGETTINKTKKKIIKKVKSKDLLIPNNEEQKENEEKKENINNNIHIEINESYSQEINNNINKEEIEKEKEKEKEKESRKDSYKNKLDNSNNLNSNHINESKDEITNTISRTDELEKSQDISNDNMSNDYKLEEVPNTNHEEFNYNKIISKKIKAIKRKKKKKLNIPRIEPNKQMNKQIEVIKIEMNNPVNGFKIEDSNDMVESSDGNRMSLEPQIEKSVDTITNDTLSKDDDNKIKSIKRTTVTKKLNFASSEKEEDEYDDDEDKDIKKKSNNNIKINEIKIDNSKINELNRIVNLNMTPNNQSISGKKSPIIKKKKKIKKKKYLISVDNKDNIKPKIVEKQLKITKTTTLIRSRSKDRKPQRTNTEDSFDSNVSNSKKNNNNEKTTNSKEFNFNVFKNGEINSPMNHDNDNNAQKKNSKEINFKVIKNDNVKSPNYINNKDKDKDKDADTTKNKDINFKIYKKEVKRSPNYNNKDKDKNDDDAKTKEINFKIYKNGTEKSSNFNEESEKEDTSLRESTDNLRKIKNNFKAKKNQKMRMAQGKNKVALIFENKEELYLEKKDIKFAKKSGINKFEESIEKDRNLNRSMDRVKHRTYKNRRFNNAYNADEIKYLMERSNSYKKINKYKKFSDKEKINCIKFENGISCLLEVNPQIFALGNLIGDILLINYHTYKEMQTIKEHDGTIISLCSLHDNSILSCSADRKMLKVRINEDGTKYNIEFVFTGYENYILKGIELMNTFKIITCSWDDKLFVWERSKGKTYKNTLIFNEGERVVDLLEVNANYFVSISENNDFKIWSSDICDLLYLIQNIKCIGAPNALCKINDFLVSVLDYHEIQLIDILEHKIVNKISIDDGNLSCIIKLNDNSILLAEDFNNDKYCVFYIKQFYYDDRDLKPISHKKDKFFKTNKNNDKEIRALAQFSNGVIVQGITGEYNGKDSGDLFFYY